MIIAIIEYIYLISMDQKPASVDEKFKKLMYDIELIPLFVFFLCFVYVQIT